MIIGQGDFLALQNYFLEGFFVIVFLYLATVGMIAEPFALIPKTINLIKVLAI